MEKTNTAAARVRHTCTSWIVAPLMMYPRNTWSSWVLTPLWIIQMLLMTNSIITIGILCFEVEGQGTHVDVGWIAALAFVFICILLTAAEVGLWFVRALHPWTFLGIQVFKTTFWLLYFCVGIATTVARKVIESNLIWPFWKIWQAVGMSLAFAVTVGALIYGSVVAHRYRRAGTFGQLGSDIYRKEDEANFSDVPSSTSGSSRDETKAFA